MINQGSTAQDTVFFKQAHDGIAKFFDYAKANPNAIVNIGDGRTMTAQQALTDITHAMFYVTDSADMAGSTGGRTLYYGGRGEADIYLNPADSNVQNYITKFGQTAGGDYEIFHELGHVLNEFAYGQAGDVRAMGTQEAAANTAGRSIETSLGMPIINDPSGLYPLYGYN